LCSYDDDDDDDDDDDEMTKYSFLAVSTNLTYIFIFVGKERVFCK